MIGYRLAHCQTRRRWRAFAGFLFIALILFPYGLFIRLWPPVGPFLRINPGSHSIHVVAHLLVFLLVGRFLLSHHPRLVARPGLYLALLAGLGLLQEILQLIGFKHRPPGPDELFDLGVDLVGAGVAYFMTRRRLKEMTQ